MSTSISTALLAYYVAPAVICMVYVLVSRLWKKQVGFPWKGLLVCLIPGINLAVAAILVAVGIVLIVVMAFAFVIGGLPE